MPTRLDEDVPPTVTLDKVIAVLNVSVFSPFFAIFVPLALLARGHASSSAPVRLSHIYNIIVGLYAIFSYLLPRIISPSSSFPSSLLCSFHPTTDWSSQIVVITGGASGIGALLAQTLVLKGVTVAVLDIQEGDGTRGVTYYRCDISKKSEVDEVAKLIEQDIGTPTMLINNAGVVKGKKILDLSEDDINQTFGVNVLSHFWTIKAFLPAMIASKKPCHIMTVASILGIVGSARMTDYCASKSALIQLHDALRFELSSCSYTPIPPPITLTLLLPAHISTSLFARIKFPRSWLFRFMCPTLEPHEVVKAMVERLGRGGEGWNGGGGSGTVCLPAYAWSAPLVRWLPGLRELGQWISHADHAMDNFHPETETSPSPAKPSQVVIE